MEEGGRYGIIAGKNRFSGRRKEGRRNWVRLAAITLDDRGGREGKKIEGRRGKKEGTHSLAGNMEEKGRDCLVTLYANSGTEQAHSTEVRILNGTHHTCPRNTHFHAPDNYV